MLNETVFSAAQGGVIVGTRVMIDIGPHLSADTLLDLVTLATHKTPLRALQCLVFTAVRLGLPVRIVDDAYDLLPDYILSTEVEEDPWADEPTIEMEAR